MSLRSSTSIVLIAAAATAMIFLVVKTDYENISSTNLKATAFVDRIRESRRLSMDDPKTIINKPLPNSAGLVENNYTDIDKFGLHNTLPPPVVCGVSVIIGNYERTMKEPDPPLLDVFTNEGRKTNLFMYTDQEHLLNNKNSAWTALPIDDSIWQKDCLRYPDAINNPCKNLHPFNFAKFYKTQPYRLEAIREAGCNVVVWFDGSIKLHDPSFFRNMASRAHRGQNFVVYTHSYLKGRVEDEARASLYYYTKKIFHGHEQPPQDTMAQYNYYVQQGFKEHWFNDVDNGVRYPEKYGMFVTCMVMFDLRQSITKEFLDCWWEENLYRTYQDQVSFPYCAWKLGVYPHALPDAETQGGSYEENPYFTKMKHMK